MVEKVFSLRHGQTEWTLSGQHTGSTDLSLTKQGQREAQLLGQSLCGVEFTHVFCSPLLRAVQTATLALLSKNMIIDPDLVEINYGVFEGLTSKQIAKIDPEWSVFSKTAPKGETLREVKIRADRVIKRVTSIEGKVAIVSSGHFSRILASRWLNQEVSFAKHLQLSTAAKSILGFEHGNRALDLWNDTSHIKMS